MPLSKRIAELLTYKPGQIFDCCIYRRRETAAGSTDLQVILSIENTDLIISTSFIRKRYHSITLPKTSEINKSTRKQKWKQKKKRLNVIMELKFQIN